MVKRNLMILSGLLGAMALTASARASLTDGTAVNPYQSIWMRNVFALKPGNLPIAAPNTDPPPANIKLTGITTIFGDKKALFMVQAAAAPGKPAGPEQSYILGEGQQRGALEVLAINPKAGTVQIRNDGILSTITFSSNNIASTGQKMAEATPVPHPGFGRSPASSQGFIPGNPGETPRNFTVPDRAPRTAYDPTPAAVYYGGYIGSATAPVANPTSPAPATGAQTSTPTSATPQPDVMSQAAAAIAQAQAQAAKQGRFLIQAAPPVNETFTQFDGTTGTASTPTVSTPVPPESFTVPPVPNLPTPPALPDSLLPHK